MLNVLLDLPYVLMGLIITSMNGWLALLAALAAAAIATLPGFPTLPSVSSEMLGAVSFFLPVKQMIGVFATFVTAWVIWLVAAPAIRWFKEIP